MLIAWLVGLMGVVAGGFGGAEGGVGMGNVSMSYVRGMSMWGSGNDDNRTRDGSFLNMDYFNMDFGRLLVSLFVAIVWITFLVCYYSRFVGWVATKVLNRLVFRRKENEIHLGSLSLSLLSGKVMFRDVVYVCQDFSLRIQDGYFVFRYWKLYKPRKLGEDFSHPKEPRLLCHLNGVEFHAYNHSETYRELERLFGLEVVEKEDMEAQLLTKTPPSPPLAPSNDSKLKATHELWRSLFPLVQYEILSGRLVFGNRFLPTTLVVSVENVSGHYTTKPASNVHDLFMHSLRGNCENLRVALVKSKNYTGTLYEQPPRTMGEGFVVLQSASLEYHHFQDELGRVESSCAHQDMEKEEELPAWGTHFRLGKNTVISYGPWADKQRDFIYKFFYPPDYQTPQPTTIPRRGERRMFVAYDLRVMTLNNASMDILFLRHDDLNAIHLGITQGSYVEVNVPWYTKETGFESKVKGLLMNVEIATSMGYRQVGECETLEFTVDMSYPRCWNALQVWDYKFVVSKATVWIVYNLKNFIQDLMDEWGGETGADILRFVPYIWNYSVEFKDFELAVMLNEHNWIDTSSQNEENCQAAIRGKCLSLNFALPYDTFLPHLAHMDFSFSASTLQLLLRLPEQNLNNHVLHSLHSSLNPEVMKLGTEVLWENLTSSADDGDWLILWSAPGATLNLKYHYHPVAHLHKYHLPPELLAKLDLEDSLQKFSPTDYTPDLIDVSVDLSQSTVAFSAALIKYILIFKENYLGEYQNFTDIHSFSHQNNNVEKPYGKVMEGAFDARKYRPLHVQVSIQLRHIEAYCLMHQSPDPAYELPKVRIEQLVFEMNKRYTETELQLVLSPVTAHFNGPLSQGLLLLDSFQMRGHAMFSAAGLPVDSPTVEYGWLTELIVGKVKGALSVGDCVAVGEILDSSLFLLLNEEETLPSPLDAELCQHMQPRTMCFFSKQEGTLCPMEHDLKYKFIRLSVDTLDLFLTEPDSALHLSSAHIRLATCTFHTHTGKEGVSLSLPHLTLQQYVHSPPLKKLTSSDVIRGTLSDTNIQGRSKGGSIRSSGESSEGDGRRPEGKEDNYDYESLWLKCGHFILRHTTAQIALPILSTERSEHTRNFMLLHDERSKRLSFLWSNGVSTEDAFKCGCLGGCGFFGSNVNGKGFFNEDRTELAVVSIHTDNSFNPGFGQSLLRYKDTALIPMMGDFPTKKVSMGVTAGRMASVEDDEFYMAEQETIVDSALFMTPDTNLSPDIADADNFSFKSTCSHQEEPTVDLYGQVNRPVLTSPMLMGGYTRCLDQAVCSNWSPLVNPTKPIQDIPQFRVIRLGLNGAVMVHDPHKDHELQQGPLTKEGNAHHKKTRRGSLQGKTHRFDANLSETPTFATLEVSGTVGKTVDIMISPLGIEVFQRMLDYSQDALVTVHPFAAIQKQFAACSNNSHIQALTKVATNEALPIPKMNASLLFPKINFLVLQCGVVEKLIPFSDLSSVGALTQTTAMMFTTKNFRASAATSDKATSPADKDNKGSSKMIRVMVMAEMEGIYGQLLQISESDADIGISRNASRIPYFCDWSHIEDMKSYQSCVFMETGIHHGSLRASCKLGDVKTVLEEAAATEAANYSPSHDDSMTSPNAELEDDDSQISKAAIDIGPVITNFGLLRPLEDSQDCWPVYDLLAPTLSAWIHVLHRFKNSLNQVQEDFEFANEITVLWLLTEALDYDGDKLIAPKSKFAQAKQGAKNLQACPSCQILLALFRYCKYQKDMSDAWKTVKDLNDVKDRMNVRKLRKALVALLSHWQTVLCAEHTVTINSAIAAKFLGKDNHISSEPLTPHSVMDQRIQLTSELPPVFSNQAEASAAGVSGTANLNTQTGKEKSNTNNSNPNKLEEIKHDRIDGQQPKRRHSRAESGVGVVGPGKISEKTRRSTTESKKVRAGSTSPSSHRRDWREAGASATENLYQWMKDQQKTIKHHRKGKSTVVMMTHVNPMDVPLNIYFEPFFRAHGMEPNRRGVSLLRLLGGSLGFSIWLDEIKIGIVEPKFLAMVGSDVKRLGFTERHLLGFDIVNATGQVKHESSLVRESDILSKTSVLRITYHLNCKNTVCTLGFPSASFLNQISFVMKSLLETHGELLTASDRNHYATFDAPDSASPMVPESSRPIFFRRGTKSTETLGSFEDSSVGGNRWQERMVGILKDYQRSQRRSERLRGLRPASDDLPLKLIVFGVIDFKLMSIQALMKELVVFVTINNLQLGHSWRERRSFEKEAERTEEISITASLHKALLILSEGDTVMDSNRQRPLRHDSRSTIMNVTFETSRLLFSRTLHRDGIEWDNSLLVEIGPVIGDVPMHPGFLHDFVVRTSRNIQYEVGKMNPPTQIVEEKTPKEGKQAATSIGQYSRAVVRSNPVAVINFDLSVCNLKLKAQLLPSVWATYHMEGANSSGTTGSEAKFVAKIHTHNVVFCVTSEKTAGTEQPPKPIQLDLPCLTGNGAYIHAQLAAQQSTTENDTKDDKTFIYQEGGYLKIELEIGKFEHTLTTYLLNQILFVQEAFRREIGDIVARITAEKPAFIVPSSSPRDINPMLFSLEIHGPSVPPCVQITATTPTSTAIRLTIDQLTGQLTNRWLHRRSKDRRERLFGTATIQLSLVLGQLVKPATYEEVEAEFQQFGYFKTQVQMQNVESGAEVPDAAMAASSYTYLINVHRPVVFIQPSAVDKAVLLWLNYKNTYEFWNEQRQQIRSRTPAVRHSSFIMSPDEPGSVPLFLKLSVDSGLTICMPLYSVQYPETNAALLVSLEKTDIAVCSLGALVSKGSFSGFCIRFAENFDAMGDNWRPDHESKPDLANSCYVPEGTYDVCSRTCAPTDTNLNAEWFLNVQWKMEGMDLQLNSKIGKLASLMMTTLTSLAGEGDDMMTVPGSERESSAPGSDIPDMTETVDELGELAGVPVGKQRTKMIEKAMNDQALTVSALRTLGATEATIEIERRKLQRLEVVLFNEFRREMVEKLRRQSQKAVSLKDRLGLGVRPHTSSGVPPTSRLMEPTMSGRRLSEVPNSRREAYRTAMRGGSLDAGYVDIMPPILAADESQEDLAGDSSSQSSVEYAGSSPDSSGVNWRVSESPPEVTRKASQTLSDQNSMDASSQLHVNLYLDVKIIIESGNCTLLTLPKEGDGDLSNPPSARSKSLTNKKGKSKPIGLLAPPPITKTTIAMPSLSLSSYYASKSDYEATYGSPGPARHMRSAGLEEDIVSQMVGGKRAQFYMYTALESMPDETVVSPHLMDFLQEALEPISSAQNILSWNPESEGTDNKFETEVPQAEAAALAAVSFPVDFIFYFLVQSSTIRFTSQPTSMVECLLKLPQLHVACTSRKSSDLVIANNSDASSSTFGGHGGTKRQHSASIFRVTKEEGKDDEMLSGGISVTASLKDFSLFIFHPYGATSGEGGMHQRRDALSLSVDAIIVNMTRSRNLLTASDASSADLKNSVKFSLIVDVNKACFRYDMRRLKEILSFPKAWYRRAIMRRFFLGDESASTASSQNLSKGKDSFASQPSTPKPSYQDIKGAKGSDTKEKGCWEALVLYALRCEQLEVEANMGQTMGLTSWITKDSSLQGHFGVNSSGSRNVQVALQLASSMLEARTGVIGGMISLSNMGFSSKVKKDPGEPPNHILGAELEKSEARVEWMSTVMFLGRCSGMTTHLEDEWLTVTGDDGVVDQSQVYVNGKIRWKELQIMITKSTVNDLIRIYNKLSEFFEQQVKRGRQVLFYPATKEKKKGEGEGEEVVLKHHHHWQNPLQLITQIQLSLKFFPLPRLSTIVGGILDLAGEEIALSCFHGATFRAPTWALFNIRYPAITFSADARDVILGEEGDIGTLVSQTLIFRLGDENSVRRAEETMAIIARVQQGRFVPPPSPGTVEEWLSYAQSSILKQVYGHGDGSSSAKKDTSGGKNPHSVVQLFRLPAFELELRSTQRQADEEPSAADVRPVVHCAFVAQFQDHLFVSSNVEALYFLHELINLYMQEKQMPAASRGGGGGEGGKTRVGHPMEELQKDGRHFSCDTWVLEPTVRFIEVGPYEPFGVDYILQKLGFRHARSTIPKWMQRGFMDPLDSLLAIIMEKMLLLAKKG